MKRIPYTNKVIITTVEAASLRDSLTLGADTIEALQAEGKMLLGIIASQANTLDVLMTLQNAMADTITAADADGITVAELRERLTNVVSEFVA